MATVGAAAVLFSAPRGLWWYIEMVDRREQYKENSWSFDAHSPESARMKAIWEYAASHPWLPIDPDWPTDPE